MRVCPQCKSDSFERTSSTGLRVVFCIILIFIPLGIFIAWVPFVFPHTYECKNCSRRGNESELDHVDWRERETILANDKALDHKLSTVMEYWFEQMGSLYKITKEKHMFILVKVSEQEVYACHIHDLTDNNFLVEHLGPNFPILNDMEFDWEPTDLGRSLFTSDELEYIQNRDYSGLKQQLQNKNQLVQPFNIYEK